MDYRKGIVLLIALTLTAGIALAQDEGIKRIERLTKRAEDSVKKIQETEQQLQKTLILYNSIMDNSAEDLAKTYRDLVKAVERSEKNAEETRKNSELMEQEAHNHFAEWTKNLESITSENLRKRSQERLNETRLQYSEILRSGRSARGEFDAFIDALRDQIVYLGYDLNPAAVASLKEDAAKLNEQANGLFKMIDDVVNSSNEYIRSLQPE
jgi:hypothetical protein